jgi:hypothetical protein
MKTIFQETCRAEILRRVERLRPDTPARWGRCSAHQIICHLADQVRIGLGETPGGPAAGWLSKWPINKLLIHLLPWPKGAPTPREAWTTAPGRWEADLATLAHLLEQLGRRSGSHNWPSHPLFGKINGRDWARLTYRHFDHHLRQFGC